MQTENALCNPSGFVDSESSKGEIKEGHWRELIRDDAFTAIPKVRECRHSGNASEMRQD